MKSMYVKKISICLKKQPIYVFIIWHIPQLKVDAKNGWPLKAIFLILRITADITKHNNEVWQKIVGCPMKVIQHGIDIAN